MESKANFTRKVIIGEQLCAIKLYDLNIKANYEGNSGAEVEISHLNDSI